tara:strand:- start:293 stop:1411 length:1119 start_codon:yes stop_codon:yes gene_type:complete
MINKELNNKDLISEIHASKLKLVIVSSGGGTDAIASLLKHPGSSKTVLEAYIPYAQESLDYYLLKKPDQYCSLDTTLSMAAKAYSAAKQIDKNNNIKDLVGIAITATLSTTYKKRGSHRFFIVLQTRDYSKSISCILDKGSRTREMEEQLVTQYVVNLLAENANLPFQYPNHSEETIFKTVEAKKDWIKLINDKIDFVSSTNRKPELIFPGSFNPLHSGHTSMKKLAENKTGMEVTYEVCIQNADKPPLSYHAIDRTLNQFHDNDNWVMTKAGKFSDKAMMFPDSVFIIGADTLVRILNEKFYLSRKDMIDQLDLFNSNNINFLVFGRKLDKKFITLQDIDLPEHISDRFTGFAEEMFRDDISSTLIRLESS